MLEQAFAMKGQWINWFNLAQQPLKKYSKGFPLKKKQVGKGRPVHIYRVNGKILERLGMKLRQKQKDLDADIKKLDEISSILRQKQQEPPQKMNA